MNIVKKGKMVAYKKKWVQDNKKEISIYKKKKLICECGIEITRGCIYKHKKRKIHLDKMKKLSSVEVGLQGGL